MTIGVMAALMGQRLTFLSDFNGECPRKLSKEILEEFLVGRATDGLRLVGVELDFPTTVPSAKHPLSKEFQRPARHYGALWAGRAE